MPRLLKSYDEVFQPFMAHYESLFEKYLVCVTRRTFPYGDELIFPKATANPSNRVFSVIAMEFTLLMALAIRMAEHYRESFGRELVVKLARSVSRGFERNLDLRRSILEFMGKKELCRTENLAVMLRN
jgi:hypothetical protein